MVNQVARIHGYGKSCQFVSHTDIQDHSVVQETNARSQREDRFQEKAIT